MKKYDDELDPQEWIQSLYSKSPFFSREISQSVKTDYLEYIYRTHNKIPTGAVSSTDRHHQYSDTLEINMNHQRTFLRDILVGEEIETWNQIYSSITPRDTFEAFASETPRGDTAILLTAPVFLSCINFSDFLVWRTRQEGKRLHEFNQEQQNTFFQYFMHIVGAILGFGTLVSSEDYRKILPGTEGEVLAKAASATSMLFFIIAHEFAHFHLRHHSNSALRADGNAEKQADELAVKLLVRHIYFNGPKMGLNRSVIPLMLLAPFTTLSLCKIVLGGMHETQAAQQPTLAALLDLRFESMRERFYGLLIDALGNENFLNMAYSLEDYFFYNIKEIGVWIFGEVDVFATAFSTFAPAASAIYKEKTK